MKELILKSYRRGLSVYNTAEILANIGYRNQKSTALLLLLLLCIIKLHNFAVDLFTAIVDYRLDVVCAHIDTIFNSDLEELLKAFMRMMIAINDGTMSSIVCVLMLITIVNMFCTKNTLRRLNTSRR